MSKRRKKRRDAAPAHVEEIRVSPDGPNHDSDDVMGKVAPPADETPRDETQREEETADEVADPHEEQGAALVEELGAALVDEPPQPPDPVAEAEERARDLEGRLRAVSAAYQRQLEEISSTRERLERQSAAREQIRRGEAVAAIFEPLENLRRSIEALRGGAGPEDTLRGLEMVVQQFMEALKALGLEEVPGKGARFDPNLHEGVGLKPVDDPALDGIVVEVFASGYRIGDRLIRPARVIIGQLQAPQGEA